MLPKNSAAGSMCYGIIVGGHDADPPSDYSGNLRVYFPGIHGTGVDVKHLAFSPRLMAPSRAGQQEFSGGLDPGSLVLCMKDTGSNQCQILGLANDINKSDSMIPGNMSLLQGISQYLTMPIQVNSPPSVSEAVVGGALIRQLSNKGQWNHGLTKGLPTSLGLFNLAGIVMPQVKNVATAIQSMTSMPTVSTFAGLPGIAMSIGGLLSTILNSKTHSKSLSKSMTPNILESFMSMSYLLQSIEQRESAGFMAGTRVNQDVYVNNAVALLGQAVGVGDMVNIFQRLQYDTSIMGLDSLASVVTPIITQNGTSYQSYSPTGQSILYTPQAVVQAAKSISSILGGLGFIGAIPGQNLFDGVGGPAVLFSMFSRLGPAGSSNMIGLLTTIQSAPAKFLIDNATRALSTGTNPITAMFPGL